MATTSPTKCYLSTGGDLYKSIRDGPTSKEELITYLGSEYTAWLLKRYLSFNDALCEYVGNEGKSNEDIEKVEEKEYEDLTLLARDKDF